MNWIGSLTRVKIRLGLGSRHLVCLPVPPPDPEHQVATSWCGRCLPLVYRVSTPGPELGRSPRTVKAFREATNGILGELALDCLRNRVPRFQMIAGLLTSLPKSVLLLGP
jgi:hypothetical protein